MRILLTGASGFLGQTIKNILNDDVIISVGRDIADIKVDLVREVPSLPACDTVIHAAGKAHIVPKSDLEKKEFFDVNVTGTANLLKGIEQAGLPRNFVFISSVAVYGKQKGELIDENESLAATDIYGLSKIAAESLIQTWCKRNRVNCTILRLPLLAGPNPPGNLEAMIKGIKKGYYFNIDGGKAKKSIVLANDVAHIIPKAAELGGIYNLTDGCHPSFIELAQVIAKQLGKSNPLNIPLWIVKPMAKIGDFLGSKTPINTNKLTKLTSDLTFDDTKARQILGWNPTPVLSGFKIS